MKETDTGFIDKDGQQVRVNMESRQPVEWVTEENYKFRLSAFEEPLKQWLQQDPSPVCPDFRKQECIALIQAGAALSFSIPQCGSNICHRGAFRTSAFPAPPIVSSGAFPFQGMPHTAYTCGWMR